MSGTKKMWEKYIGDEMEAELYFNAVDNVAPYT